MARRLASALKPGATEPPTAVTTEERLQQLEARVLVLERLAAEIIAA